MNVHAHTRQFSTHLCLRAFVRDTKSFSLSPPRLSPRSPTPPSSFSLDISLPISLPITLFLSCTHTLSQRSNTWLHTQASKINLSKIKFELSPSFGASPSIGGSGKTNASTSLSVRSPHGADPKYFGEGIMEEGKNTSKQSDVKGARNV